MNSTDVSFPLVGNNLAIDFVNTEIVDRGHVIELLNSTADVFQWAHAAGISTDGKAEDPDLSIVKELRAALKELFVAKMDHRSLPRKALDTINQHLIRHSTEQQLKSIKGELKLHSIHKNLSLEMLLGRIAHEAALLLTSAQINQLKRCSNPKCILMFLDTSRSRKRRWCSMEVCGNRAKAATHYLNTKGL